MMPVHSRISAEFQRILACVQTLLAPYAPALILPLALGLAAFAPSERIARDPQVLEVMPAEVGKQVAELGATVQKLVAHARTIAQNVKPRADVVDRVAGGEDKAWRVLRARVDSQPMLLAADVKASLASANHRIADVAADLQLMTTTIETRRTMVRSLPLARPVNGIVTSPFGPRTSPIKGSSEIHRGIDIAAPKGSIVVAPAAGVVLSVGQQTGYGYSVVIDHGMGVVTVFAHLWRATIKPRDHVKRGQMIAVIGMTGHTTGPHLHYEVRIDGQAVDPQPFLSFDLPRAEAITAVGSAPESAPKEG